MADLLAVSGLRAGYGRAVVLSDIAFRLGEGEALAVLGRNGVGKTTLIDSIVGVTRRFARLAHPRRPRDRDAGARGAGGAGHRLGAAGAQYLPLADGQENITAVARPGPWTLERIFGLFPRLKERRSQSGGSLSGGEQQMLAIGRALATNPRLLLLDEPTEGLAPIIIEELLRALRQLFVEERHGGHRGRAARAQDPADHRPRDRARTRPHRVRRRRAPRCWPTARRSSATSELPARNRRNFRNFRKFRKTRLQSRPLSQHPDNGALQNKCAGGGNDGRSDGRVAPSSRLGRNDGRRRGTWRRRRSCARRLRASRCGWAARCR